MRKAMLFCLAVCGFIISAAPATAEYMESTEADSAAVAEMSSATMPALQAELIDKEIKAKAQSATVKVEIQGVQIVDPAQANEIPRPGEGHLHYRVDDGPEIATTAAKLSFHDLKKGHHVIHVALAGNDHKPLGPQQSLTVDIS